MKITLIAKHEHGWHQDQLADAAVKYNVDFEAKDIFSLNDFNPDQFGDVVIWRSSSLDIFSERTTLLGILNNKYVINNSLFTYPFITHKLFQQNFIKNNSGVKSIPTFTFKNHDELLAAINAGTLKYPFIQKPNLGSKGNGVSLIKNQAEIDEQKIPYKKFIFQNFIKNDGDYRVLILGGKVIGVMKRTAAEGNFLNNVSQGGSAVAVTDSKVIYHTSKVALDVASIFGMNMCGVDVMYSAEEDKYYFLEINTAPQWSGFQEATGINVGEEVVKYAIAMGKRESSNLFELIKNHYGENFKYISEKNFHYASRLYLWTKNEEYRQQLDNLYSDYIGSDENVREKLQQIVARNASSDVNQSLSKKLRHQFIDKYPLLYKLNSLLFFNLFSNTIYNKNLHDEILLIMPDTTFLEYKQMMENDRDAIAAFSTHAVNFFYLLNFYFQNTDHHFDLNPEFLYDIAMNFPIEENADTLHLQIYLLTHCIIGESYFYLRKVSNYKEIYQKMILQLEKIISEKFFDVSLDNKFEFLVCCKLCDYVSNLEKIIMQEAKLSLSPVGNFIIDTHNSNANKSSNKMSVAEHRNVLFLMANMDFNVGG